MTLLDRVAGGNILGPKEERERDFTGSKADSDDIRARIKADLLPYQKAVVEDTEHRIIGFVAGYGAGKAERCAPGLFFVLSIIQTHSE